MKITKIIYAKLVLIVFVVVGMLAGCRQNQTTDGESVALVETVLPEPTAAIEPTEIATPIPEEMVQHELLENGVLVFRYEEDGEVLDRFRENNFTDVDVELVLNGMDIVKEGNILFLEEPKQLDVLYVGTIFVPKDIAYDSVIEIINTVSNMAYIKYQKEYPEAASDLVMFMGEAESDFSKLEYSEYDYFEYKKLTQVMVWKDETFSEITYRDEFMIVIDICFQ